MKTNRATKRAPKMFAPAAWQRDPSQLDKMTNRVQLWSASGNLMGLVSVEEAKELVTERAFFIGSAAHLCQVHDRIDGSNAK